MTSLNPSGGTRIILGAKLLISAEVNMNKISKSKTTIQTQRERLLKLRADRLAQTIAKDNGQLLDRNDIVREQYHREMIIKESFLDLGEQLAPVLVGKGQQEIQAIITERACWIMRNLAETLPETPCCRGGSHKGGK